MSALAALPFSRLRQPRMTLAAFSRTKCREASSPRPMFPPVTMTTFPVQSAVGYGRVVYCDMMNWGTELRLFSSVCFDIHEALRARNQDSQFEERHVREGSAASGSRRCSCRAVWRSKRRIEAGKTSLATRGEEPTYP